MSGQAAACTAVVPARGVGVIYRLTSPSGLSYVGQTRNLKTRLVAHRYPKSCMAIGNAVKKYGMSAMRVEVLMSAIPLASLNFWEGFFVAALGTLAPNGYNLGPGGNAQISMSAETRARISRAGLGRGPEYRSRLSASAKARWEIPGVREEHSERMNRVDSDPLVRAKMSSSASRVMRNPGARAKLSESAKRQWADPEAKARMLEPLRVSRQSPEYRQKSRDARSAPEWRAALAERTRAGWASLSPEARRARVEASRLGGLRRGVETGRDRSQKADASLSVPLTGK